MPAASSKVCGPQLSKYSVDLVTLRGHFGKVKFGILTGSH